MAILARKLPANSAGDALSLSRLLIEMSQNEVYSVCEYKRRHSTDQAKTGLLHCALRRQNCNIQIREFIDLILKNGFDLEAQDVNGNTPLLYALYYVPEFQLVEIVNTLIGAGADVNALNKYGEGCLHLLLRRLSACNNHNMSIELEQSLIGILVTLLENGCEPTLSNEVGYTPIDAALSPTAWTLFCRALKRAGKSMENELLTLDNASGIVQLDEEIEERFSDVVAGKYLIKSRPPEHVFVRRYTNQPCYLCGGSNSLEERRAPFDEFISRVVEELGYGVHMMLCKHEYGDRCLEVQEEDSCHFLDYQPNEMSKGVRMNRSWRRHVAYRMWHRGILQTLSDCQNWAARGEVRL